MYVVALTLAVEVIPGQVRLLEKEIVAEVADGRDV